MKRRLELPESLQQRLGQLSREQQQEIGRLLERVESGNPTALAPLSLAHVSILMRRELEPYRADIESRAGTLSTCQSGGYRFYFLVYGDLVTLMAMAPRPKLRTGR